MSRVNHSSLISHLPQSPPHTPDIARCWPEDHTRIARTAPASSPPHAAASASTTSLAPPASPPPTPHTAPAPPARPAVHATAPVSSEVAPHRSAPTPPPGKPQRGTRRDQTGHPKRHGRVPHIFVAPPAIIPRRARYSAPQPSHPPDGSQICLACPVFRQEGHVRPQTDLGPQVHRARPGIPQPRSGDSTPARSAMRQRRSRPARSEPRTLHVPSADARPLSTAHPRWIAAVPSGWLSHVPQERHPAAAPAPSASLARNAPCTAQRRSHSSLDPAAPPHSSGSTVRQATRPQSATQRTARRSIAPSLFP